MRSFNPRFVRNHRHHQSNTALRQGCIERGPVRHAQLLGRIAWILQPLRRVQALAQAAPVAFAGRAQIDASYLGEVTVLSRDQMRAAFGRDADVRAWSLYRSHARGCVRVQILDPRDPAPYWLVCTNDPESLAHAIASAKDQAAHSEQTGSPFSS